MVIAIKNILLDVDICSGEQKRSRPIDLYLYNVQNIDGIRDHWDYNSF